MSDRNVKIRVLFDGSRFVAALRNVVKAMGDLARAAEEWMQRLNVSLDELQHSRRTALRMDFGPKRADEYGHWQSWMCAAWLHDSCQHPAMTECGCTCHGGDLR